MKYSDESVEDAIDVDLTPLSYILGITIGGMFGIVHPYMWPAFPLFLGASYMCGLWATVYVNDLSSLE